MVKRMDAINHEIKIDATPEIVFKALSTRNGIKSWFTSTVEGTGAVGSEWKLHFKDKLEFHWKILASDTNKHVAWNCLQGPGHSVGTSVVFDISPLENDRTLLVVSHLNWPSKDENFRKCNTLWGMIIYHLKQYSETHVANPAL